MDKKLILVGIGCLVGGWIAHDIYSSCKEKGVIEFDPEKFKAVKGAVSEASHAMNAVSNFSKEVRLS